jgi:hypothetical protein
MKQPPTHRSRIFVVRAIAIALLAALSAVPARAETPVLGACPQPGTVMAVSVGVTLTVASADGLTCGILSSASGAFAMFGLLLRQDSQRTPTPQGLTAVQSLWPLAAGKSASYSRRDEDGTIWTESYRIGAARKVTVKAGSFDAFPVILSEIGRRPGAGTGVSIEDTITNYIAPSLGYIVKFEFRATKGDIGGAPPNWELVSVTPPP